MKQQQKAQKRKEEKKKQQQQVENTLDNDNTIEIDQTDNNNNNAMKNTNNTDEQEKKNEYQQGQQKHQSSKDNENDKKKTLLDESFLIEILTKNEDKLKMDNDNDATSSLLTNNRNLVSFIQHVNDQYQSYQQQQQQQQTLLSTNNNNNNKTKSSKKNKKNKNSNNNNINTNPNNNNNNNVKDIIPIFSTKTIIEDSSNSINTIQCKTCEDSTKSFFQCFTCKKHNSNTVLFNMDTIATTTSPATTSKKNGSNLTIPIIGKNNNNNNSSNDDDDILHAFDYIAMEEGETTTTDDSNTSIIFRTTDTLTTNNTNVKEKDTTNETYYKYIKIDETDFFPCTLDKIIYFIKLLLSSVYSNPNKKTKEVSSSNSTQEPNNTTNDGQDNTKDNTRTENNINQIYIPKLLSSIKGRKIQLNQQIKKLENTINNIMLSPTTYDVKTSTNLQETDRLCKLWFIDITTLLYHLSISYNKSSCKSSCSKDNATTAIEHLWSIYDNNIIKSLLQYMLHFQQKQIECSQGSNYNSSNDIPKLYLSLSLRQYYLQYIHNKYTCINELYNHINTALPSIHTSNNTEENMNYNIISSILNQRISLVYTTVLRGNINDIVHEQMEHVDKIYNYLSHDTIPLQQNRTLSSATMNDDNGINPNHLIQDISNTLNKCCININNSIKQLLFSNNQQEQQKQKREKEFQEYCIKRCKNGSRRFIIILASWLYKWLEVRCIEWNALLTEQELLDSFSVTSSSTANTKNQLNNNGDGKNNNNNESRKKRNSRAKKQQQAISSQDEKNEEIIMSKTTASVQQPTEKQKKNQDTNNDKVITTCQGKDDSNNIDNKHENTKKIQEMNESIATTSNYETLLTHRKKDEVKENTSNNDKINEKDNNDNDTSTTTANMIIASTAIMHDYLNSMQNDDTIEISTPESLKDDNEITITRSKEEVRNNDEETTHNAVVKDDSSDANENETQIAVTSNNTSIVTESTMTDIATELKEKDDSIDTNENELQTVVTTNNTIIVTESTMADITSEPKEILKDDNDNSNNNITAIANNSNNSSTFTISASLFDSKAAQEYLQKRFDDILVASKNNQQDVLPGSKQVHIVFL